MKENPHNVNMNLFLFLTEFYNFPLHLISKDKKLSCPIIETHIISFNQDIYFEEVEVEFYSFIRKERKFASLEELKNQIASDKEKIIAYFQ